ncbi:site-specific integrase [Endozoicomonas euniceicola]|uniref:Site-specific integrase n=1 Tax=Endozoicomonas euniceicola TaxID=1234143 RepID=A0ABY6GWC8_9GAMM|nr:site-specific integrase [Endozoicomonas euniceicola]UYM17077.1 site-specific integrase [Endozoicomonas euniceicola]
MSHNSVLRKAYELKFFLIWLKEKKIDVLSRVKSGDYLTDQETNDYCSCAKYRRNHEHFLNIPPSPTDKYLSNVLHQVNYREAIVSPSVTNGRLSCTSDYLQFLDRELNHEVQPEQAKKNLERTLLLLNDAHRKEIRNGYKLTDHVQLKTIPASVMDRIFEIIHVDHKDNPFNKNVRFRNQLIIRLLIDTGIRRGALAKLKISDITFGGNPPKIYISNERKDDQDVRSNKPQQKTKDHFSYTTKDTMGMLKDYIENHRSIISLAKRHEFVFITNGNSKYSKGTPMSLDSINYIFEQLSKAANYKVYPHLLRHCWNERFSVLAKELNLSESEIDKYRKLLMGWSPTSIMPERYDKIHKIEKTQEIHREYQDKIMSPCK